MSLAPGVAILGAIYLSMDAVTHHWSVRPFRRVLNRSRLRGKGGTVAVEIRANDVGFFAQLNWCLYVLAYCEQRKLNPWIRLTGPPYGDVPNHDWFHDFFEETGAAVRSDRAFAQRPYSSVRITHIQETTLAATFAPSMTIEHAHRLFKTYYRVKDRIQSYVDNFVATEFTGDGVIGLHFRGTDKKSEADPVDWSRCFRSVMKLATDRPEMKKVFISSDDPRFIDWFVREANCSLSVIVHPDEERSRDGQPVHKTAVGSNYWKGFEALVNCLLLSRCAALIRTASFLSGWSSVFNPELPITLLNEPFARFCWFPDHELVKRSDNRYL